MKYSSLHKEKRSRFVPIIAGALMAVSLPVLTNPFPVHASDPCTLPQPVAPTSTAPIPTEPTVEPGPAPQEVLTVHLNETVANPLEGPEWVELTLDESATETDRDLLLFDTVGKFKTVSAGTPVTAPGFLVVTLSSARLNNGGDDLILKEADETIIDETVIPATDKGEAWAFDGSDWSISPILTPGFENLFAIPVEEEPEEEPAAESTPEEESTETPEDPDTTSTTSNSEEADSNLEAVINAAILANESLTDTNRSGDGTEQISNMPDDLTPYSIDDMFDPNLNEARVRLTGATASIPRLFGATHAFVLQNEDGRGVIVYLPKHLNVPPFGSVVTVGGTLKSTYLGPELRMKKTDIWMSSSQTVVPEPRIVDLLAPSVKDAWSLTAVEGEAQDVKEKYMVLETEDGISFRVNVPAAVGFRTKRLTRGDTVRVMGILDIRKDDPALIARDPEEIELVSHASSSVANAQSERVSLIPNWAPFVAAGGTIAAVGFGKRFRQFLKHRRLQMLAAKAHEAL